ncbi:MAG: hypothetical protein J5I53_10790 [Bradyrhizobiaceae bacterium]|nr:hypothetical protein [Bradyrhizobiaceae bacterium]
MAIQGVPQKRIQLRKAWVHHDVPKLTQLLTEAEADPSESGQAFVFEVKGTLEALDGDYAVATTLFRDALSRYEKIDDAYGKADALRAIGYIQARTGDSDGAYSTLKQSLAAAEAGNYTASIGNACLQLGWHAMTTRSDRNLALEFYQRAYQCGQECRDTYLTISALTQLGELYHSGESYDKSIEVLNEAVELADAYGVPSLRMNAFNTRGMVYSMAGMFPEALNSFMSAYQVAVDDADKSNQIVCAANISICQNSLGDLDQAEHWGKLADDLAERYELRNHWALTDLILADVFEKKENFEHAIRHARAAAQLCKSRKDESGYCTAQCVITRCLINQGAIEQAGQEFSSIDPSALFDVNFVGDWWLTSARLKSAQGDHEAANADAIRALEEAEKAVRPNDRSIAYAVLRDLAHKRNDLEGYVRYNKLYLDLEEEIRGAAVKTRIAVQAKESELAKEREARERERALLYGALPKDIADRMLAGEVVSGDVYPSAAVMFIDVVNFTSHSQSMHPREVTQILEHLFSMVDQHCEHHHVSKIKTIGDAYLAVAFPLSDDHDAMQGASTAHELRITQVALQVMQHGLSWPDGSPVQVRIGLHTGTVVAGVIGTQRLQYDVWGDTVNTASRMESTSEPGRIHASDVFAQALAQHDSPYVCTPRGTIDVKGRGSMQAYWVEAP